MLFCGIFFILEVESYEKYFSFLFGIVFFQQLVRAYFDSFSLANNIQVVRTKKGAAFVVAYSKFRRQPFLTKVAQRKAKRDVISFLYKAFRSNYLRSVNGF